MPLPPLSANGLLPPGVHEATLVEVREEFGMFQTQTMNDTLNSLDACAMMRRPEKAS
jgi:hypothetical protein